jgi:hypothetical protein
MPSDSMPPGAITILHVAAEAGVSKSTVSLVLKGSPLIPEETSQRVREAALKIGYVYNRRAAELRWLVLTDSLLSTGRQPCRCGPIPGEGLELGAWSSGMGAWSDSVRPGQR